MRTKEIVGAILALTFFLGLAPIALATAPGAPFQVGGHVYLDAATVSGADVTVTNLNTSESLTTTTDSNGAYVVPLSNLPSGHSAGNIIQVTATYNGMTGTSSAPRSENLSDSPQIIDVTIAQAVQIKAEDGGDLPDSILVGETFTVLITENGSSVGAGTIVQFRLPYDTGAPIDVSTGDDGKVNYKPQKTGILGIRVLDGTVTVAEATVEVTTETGITKQLDRVEISPDSADLLIGDTQSFSAICYATSATGGGTISDCTVTWTCDSPAVGTINSSTGLFTAGGVGTATVTASATYGYVTKTDTAIVNVSGSAETVSVDGDNFTVTIDAGTAADINVSGEFNKSVTGGSVVITPIADPEANVSVYQFTGNDEALIGLIVEPDTAVRDELADGNDTIRIKMCYNTTEHKNINLGTLAIWRFNKSTNEWVKMVKGTDPCVDNGRDGNCVWIEVNNLSKFALVGTKTTTYHHHGGGGGGSGGTYPPGWDTTTTTPAVTATAAHGATPGATHKVTPPAREAAVTKPTTKPAAAEKATPEGAEETPTKKKPGIPGFTAVFAIAGLLAIAYVLMRRRE